MASTLHDKRFRCFCGNFDVVRGALILAFIGLSWLDIFDFSNCSKYPERTLGADCLAYYSVMSFGLIICAL
uniref:Uncharacterized protein n=1 Tax=Ditylenchus dipsaci TaxID=166011 RepID=A0A915EVE3_9BILA